MLYILFMMKMDPEICYRAVASRDARFDGRFFTGVASTGVYCRPVCPSRTPKRENARFFRTAAEAEGAGFRPCLRCRPETAPGSPAWSGTRVTISQALRLLSAGYLDEHSVEELAARLGMGARHLRRLFDRHLGASPVRMAMIRRVHFARGLLADSRLPIGEVAFASGFGSLRQFNDLFRRLYRQSPLDYRRQVRADSDPGPSAPPAPSGDWLEFRLRYRPPYPWQTVLGYLERRATPGVEAVREGTYRRSITVGGEPAGSGSPPAAPGADRARKRGAAAGVIEVLPLDGENGLRLRVRLGVSRGLIQVVERVGRLFDLQVDPAEIAGHLRRDRWLAERVDALPGLRVPGCWDGFELAVRAVLGQQVSVPAATRAMGELAARFGEPFPESGIEGIDRLFPTAGRLADVDPAGLPLPGVRARALVLLAREVHDGRIRLDGTMDGEQVRERLTAIPGIGDWTAQYIIMRALGEPDAFPAADLGLLKAAAGLCGDGPARPADLQRRAEAWRPWRAYAAMALWHFAAHFPAAETGTPAGRPVDRRGAPAAPPVKRAG